MAESRSNRSVRFQDFEVLLDSGELYKSGHKIKLSGQPMQVLTLLLDKAGQMVSRDEIQKSLWPDTFVDVDHSLNAIVNRIREVLGDSAEVPKFVETLPRRGYRFIAPVERVPPSNSDAPVEAAPENHARARWHLLRMWSIGLAGALTIIALSAFWEHRRPHENSKWVQLTSFADSATSPALSPDGRMLTFIRGPETFVSPGQICIKFLPDGQPFEVTHDNLPKMGPVFSADGARVAYTATDSHFGWNTWTVPVLGGEPHEALPNAAALTWIDREHVLFSEIKSGVNMAVVTATESRSDEREVYLPPPPAGMAHRSWLSPNGEWVLVAEMDGVGWRPCRLLPFKGGAGGRIVGPPSGRCTYAGWSPDGQSMYFSVNTGDGFHLWQQGSKGGAPEQITFGPTEEEGIALAADGRSLITSVGMHEESVWLHDSKGDRRISFEGNAFLPGIGTVAGGARSVFSPDGEKLFYLRRKNSPRGFNSGELWVADLKSGKSEPVLPGIVMNVFDVSSDGKRIAFDSLNEEGSSRVWIAAADRSTPPRQLSFVESTTPIFIHDDILLFRQKEAGTHFVYAFRPDDATPHKFTTEPFLDFFQASPDGVWGISGLAATAKLMSGGPKIHICDFCEVGWGSHGKYFYLRLRDVGFGGKGKIFVFELPKGKSLPELPSKIESADDFRNVHVYSVIDTNGIVAFAPGPDPRTYAYTKVNVQRNLFRIPLN